MSTASVGQSHTVVYVCVNFDVQGSVNFVSHKKYPIFFSTDIATVKSVFRYLTNCTIKLELYDIFAEIVK